MLSALQVLPFATPADRYYAMLRWELIPRGIPIGPNEMLIAGHALSHGLPVENAKSGEIFRVPGFAVEDRFES